MFQFIKEVHQAVNGFEGACWTGLQRGPERQDTNHDNVIVWQVDYMTNLNDASADPARKLIEATITDIVVNKDLDIDNDIIRSGDGKS